MRERKRDTLEAEAVLYDPPCTTIILRQTNEKKSMEIRHESGER